jgi:hypothetical protein
LAAKEYKDEQKYHYRKHVRNARNIRKEAKFAIDSRKNSSTNVDWWWTRYKQQRGLRLGGGGGTHHLATYMASLPYVVSLFFQEIMLLLNLKVHIRSIQSKTSHN